MNAPGRALAVLAVLAVLAAAGEGEAQTLPAPVPPPLGTPPAPPAVPPPAPVAARAQPISLAAGTGALLHLPLPAATIMSAEPGVARVQPASPTSLFLMAVAPGRTTVIATTEQGLPIMQYDVTVTPGVGRPAPLGGPPAAPEPAHVTPAMASAIRSAVVQAIPGAADVQVEAAGGNAVLTGTVPNAAASLQVEAIAHGFVGEHGGVLDNLLVLGSIQVNVRVRIAEIDRQITRQLGINWQALGTIGSIGMLPALTLNTPGAVAGTGGALASAACAAGIPLSVQCKGVNFNGVIDALAADQLITILAEPNLTAQSGETASFLAGGEFPIPVAATESNGAPTVTVVFKQFGVSLAVVPTVLSPSRLNLRIRPEVSQLSNTGAVSVPLGNGSLTIPALSVRRAETTIELGSGQSFAVAGLLQRTSTDITNGLPGLGDLPVLGALFKSNQFQRGDSELVIIVTPYIVRPAASPSALHAPTDHFTPATDLDRILFGHQLGRGSDGSPPLNAGFILK